MTIKPTRGGARLNAGAPKKIETAKSHTIRFIEADWLKFQSLGGAKWLKLILSKN